MEFNIPRFIQLIRRDFLLQGKFLLLSGLSLFGLLILILFISHYLAAPAPTENAGSPMLWLLWLVIYLLIGGLLTTWNSGDWASHERRLQFLHIPASSLEKLISKWTLSLPIFLLFICLTFGSLFLIDYKLNSALSANNPQYVEEVLHLSLYFMCLYIPGHAIAFFSSFYFERFAAFKGGLSCIVLFLGLGILAASLQILFSDHTIGDFSKLFGDQLWTMMIFLGERPFWLLGLSPILWIATYFTFIQKEA